MSSQIIFKFNTATSKEIGLHLSNVDNSYVPPLSERVDIPQYAEKIFNKSNRYEFWDNGKLIALVAIYFDDKHSDLAYITNVSVLIDYRGQSLAEKLMQKIIEDLKTKNITRIDLEVSQHNAAAVALYKKMGFSELTRQDGVINMTFALRI